MKVQWQYFPLALLLSVLLWYMVTGRDKVETSFDVRIEFKNVPEGLIVREGLLSKAIVRVRGPRGLSQSLLASNNALVINFDLSSVKRGDNILPIPLNSLSFPQAFEVVDINPSRVELIVDRIISKIVPLEALVDDAVPEDILLQKVTIYPDTVTLTGPEAILSKLSVITIPLLIEESASPGVFSVERIVHTPELVEAVPLQVSVEVGLALNSRTVQLTRKVNFIPLARGKVDISPADVRLEVLVPYSRRGDTAYLEKIRANVAIPARAGNGKHTFPVTVALPEGATLEKTTPAELIVTISGVDAQ